MIISLSCVSLSGMNKEEQKELIQPKQRPSTVSMNHQKDCGNCWGNEDCYWLAEKASICAVMPCIGCFCCYLAITD
jgi:hypothetical protein